MKIRDFEVIVCNLGWRDIAFLKLTSESGQSGWSEFSESFGNAGLVPVVESMREQIIGQEAMNTSLILGTLSAGRLPAAGGLNQQAIGAVANALIDLKARLLGISVADLLGGALRTRLPVYWSHCGTFRQEFFAPHVGSPAIRRYSDLLPLSQEVLDRGFKAIKTNPLALEEFAIPERTLPWSRLPNASGRSYDTRLIAAIERTLGTFREGLGDDFPIMLDINFGFLGEGNTRVARAVEQFGLSWLELDTPDPASLAATRAAGTVPIASGESLYQRSGYRPFLEQRAMDVALIDVLWNGIDEAVKIAALAETYSTSVAPHNYYGHLATMISAQFCAVVPNFSIMELDIDGVSWRDELVSAPPVFEDGELVLPEGPGWGVEVNEEAVRAHAVRRV